MKTPRRCVAAVVAVVSLGLLASCAVEDVMLHPDCESGGSVLLVAQSVDTASYIPCLSSLPDGWSLDVVRINQDRSEVVLDSDRAGNGAAVLRLDASCDLGGAVIAPSDQPGAERYDAVDSLEPFRGRRIYLFDGGCVSWRFSFRSDASATEAVAIGDTLTLVSRAELNENIRETFVDEEL